MKFKKTEKEIIKAIVKYGDKSETLAEVFNKSHLLENKGIGIVQYGEKNLVFLRKDIYDEYFYNEGLGYIAELLSLIDTLIKKKYIIMIPFAGTSSLVIGTENASWGNSDVIRVNDNESICVAERYENWFDARGQQKYWPYKYSDRELPIGRTFDNAFSVSQELKDLVKHNFKSEEERRFAKQQRLTWISIFVSIIIGLGSLIIGVIGIFIRC